MDGGYDYVKFNGLKFCPVTLEVAKAAGWCHKHRITKRIPQSSGKGLLNFVVLYLKREVGFHSEQWMKDGEKKEIPGEQTAGRIRIIDERSAEFYELVQEGDAVRMYDRSFWRPPTFAKASDASSCVQDYSSAVTSPKPYSQL